MPVIPLDMPWEPDKGSLSQTSLDYVMNVMPLPGGWGPIPLLTEYTDALPGRCRGAWWFRNDAGVFATLAATQNGLFRLDSTTLAWTDISKTTGSELVTNGTFTTDTGWTKGTGITIAAGTAVFTSAGTGQTLRQPLVTTNGVTYRITYTVSTRSAGGVRPVLSGGTSVVGTTQTTNGTYTQELISTNNTEFQFETVGTTTLRIDNVSVVSLATYTGPSEGELWTAALYGDRFYVANLNDPLQVSIAGAPFIDAPGSPPQAKYVAVIGDFLFLANLKEGGTNRPRKWQHSKINDPTNWVIDGAPGASDSQEIPDGDDIMAILPMAGANARILQKRARRGLSFTPGSLTAFSQYDIDATRGCAAAHSVVPLGSNSYFFLSESGFVMNDEYQPIGAERVDGFFLRDITRVAPSKLAAVRASVGTLKKVIWISYEDDTDITRVIGYNWALDRWFQSDENADLFVTTATPGFVLDDLPLTLDEYPSPPMDSAYWAGGALNFGAFKIDGKLYLGIGAKSDATIETNTMQLADGSGAYVWGAELVGNLTSFTIQHGSSFTADQTLQWSAQRTRSTITGICPFSKDAKWHRFRLNITSGGSGTHVHAIRALARPSSRA